MAILYTWIKYLMVRFEDFISTIFFFLTSVIFVRSDFVCLLLFRWYLSGIYHLFQMVYASRLMNFYILILDWICVSQRPRERPLVMGREGCSVCPRGITPSPLKLLKWGIWFLHAPAGPAPSGQCSDSCGPITSEARRGRDRDAVARKKRNYSFRGRCG